MYTANFYPMKTTELRNKELLLNLRFLLKSGCITRNFSEPLNPRFIIDSGIKSRAGHNGTCTVALIPMTNIIFAL